MKNRPDKIRLGILATHPVWYHAPIYRRLYEDALFDSEVIFFDRFVSDDGTPSLEGIPDSKMPVLSGYRSIHFRNWTRDMPILKLPNFAPGVASHIVKRRYDVILLQGYDNVTVWLGIAAAKLSGAKVVFRGEAVNRESFGGRSTKETIKNVMMRLLQRGVDAFLYSCVGNKDYFLGYQIPKEKLFPFPCAVDNAFFAEQQKQWGRRIAETKAELKIGQGESVALMVGKLEERKRPLDGLNAVHALGRPDVHLVCVGEGPMEPVLRDEAERLGFRGLHIVPFQDQLSISAYYSIADVFLMLSSYDPSPKVLNEAMNFKLPVVVTDVTGTAADLVEEAVNGYVVKVGDIAGISNAVVRIVDDKAMARRMGGRSFDKVNTQATIEADVRGLKQVLRYIGCL